MGANTMRVAVLSMLFMSLAGCDEGKPLRNRTAQQVEDFQACKAGSMDPYRTIYGEIKCNPPTGVKP